MVQLQINNISFLFLWIKLEFCPSSMESSPVLCFLRKLRFMKLCAIFHFVYLAHSLCTIFPCIFNCYRQKYRYPICFRIISITTSSPMWKFAKNRISSLVLNAVYNKFLSIPKRVTLLHFLKHSIYRLNISQ